MTLRFRVPLTEHEQRISATLPKDQHGHVIHPDYVPPQYRREYAQRLLAWCERTPPADWPKYVADWFAARPPGTDRRDDVGGVSGVAQGRV